MYVLLCCEEKEKEYQYRVIPTYMQDRRVGYYYYVEFTGNNISRK